MQRRQEFSTARVQHPDLIVVDEPTAGDDPILRAKFWDRFRELRDQGRTVIVTSQYVTEAEYCDQVAVLGRGQLVALGGPEELRREGFGGEIVEVVGDGLERSIVDSLGSLDGVEAIHRLSFEQLRLTVDEASIAIPRVLETLKARGVDVRQVQEYRPNFDEVFVRLMEQSSVESVE